MNIKVEKRSPRMPRNSKVSVRPAALIQASLQSCILSDFWMLRGMPNSYGFWIFQLSQPRDVWACSFLLPQVVGKSSIGSFHWTLEQGRHGRAFSTASGAGAAENWAFTSPTHPSPGAKRLLLAPHSRRIHTDIQDALVVRHNWCVQAPPGYISWSG